MIEPVRSELQMLCADAIPNPILFRKGNMPTNAIYPLHKHDWGEFMYAFSGVIEMTVKDKVYLVLPRYGIWVPPQMIHQCCNDDAAQHCAIFIATDFCVELPSKPCSMQISPLMREMLEYLRELPSSEDCAEYSRFMRVFLDQLLIAPSTSSYLPTANDPFLRRLLKELESNPGDNRSLEKLAQGIGISERSLSRKCKKELGMTLLEWRQRLKTLKSLAMLEEGRKVEDIALELGYSSSSAFSAMFKRMMGQTPADFHPPL